MMGAGRKDHVHMTTFPYSFHLNLWKQFFTS